MPKKARLRTLMESQYVKVYETLTKFLQQNFCNIFLNTLGRNQHEKLCLGRIWNPEPVFKYIDTQWRVFSPTKSECLLQPVQMQLSPN